MQSDDHDTLSHDEPAGKVRAVNTAWGEIIQDDDTDDDGLADRENGRTGFDSLDDDDLIDDNSTQRRPFLPDQS